MATATSQLYARILERFPQTNLRFAFAYGSGVFKQLQNTSSSSSDNGSKNMIDFVLVVDNEIRFHDENLRLNGTDYSFLKWAGPYYLSRIQNEFGAACYYNTLVPVRIGDSQEDEVLIKYGVISEQALTRDLLDWDYLYLSGRLQKPVKIVKPHSNDEKKTPATATKPTAVGETSSKYKSPLYTSSSSFQQALQTNLKNALHTALLLLPSKFTLQELFVCITTLSYMGDFRMIVGENKQKCSNIVLPQMDRFTDLYKPYLIKASIENVLRCDLESGRLEQTLSPDIVYHHLSQLPKNLLKTIVRLNYKDDHYYDLEEYIYKLTSRVDYKQMVAQGVSAIVKRTAAVQSAKGVLTAGFSKSFKYSWRKLQKMMK